MGLVVVGNALMLAVVLITATAPVATKAAAEEQQPKQQQQLYEDSFSQYMEDRGYQMTQYQFLKNGTLIIVAIPMTDQERLDTAYREMLSNSYGGKVL